VRLLLAKPVFAAGFVLNRRTFKLVTTRNAT
jgi:hypothetical protein